MPLPAILPLLAQSGLATYMLREPAYNAIGSYLSGNHPKLDPYVLPALKAYMGADQAVFGGLDRLKGRIGKAESAARKAAREYAERTLKRGQPG